MTNEDNDILRLLGLMKRAGRLAAGDDPVHDLLSAGKARCIFLAADAGASITRKMRYRAGEGDVPLFPLTQDQKALGAALGRASCAVCATSDAGFAAAAAKKLAALGAADPQAADELEQKHERIQRRRAKPKKHGAVVTEYEEIDEDEFNRRYGGPHKK